MSPRAPKAWIAMVKRTVCGGCRHDRYNMGVGYCERPGIDAPVTTTKCWHLDRETVTWKSGRWQCRARSFS